jgi:hypothetical protein
VAHADYLAYLASANTHAWWPHDETSGTTLADDSGNSRHETTAGSPTLNQTSTIPGYTGPVVVMDGTNDTISVADAAVFDAVDAQGLTYHRWLKMHSDGAGDVAYIIADKTGTSQANNQWTIYWDNRVSQGSPKRLVMAWGDNPTNVALLWSGDAARDALLAGGMFTFVFHPSSIGFIYLNGELVASGALYNYPNAAGNVGNSRTLQIGHLNGSSFFFKGEMGAGAVWPFTISQAVIESLYLAETVGDGASSRTSIVEIGANADYDAFPGHVVAPNGDLIAAYSKGTSHTTATSTQGVYLRRSTDAGATWGSESKIISNDASTRWSGPSLSVIGSNCYAVSWSAPLSGSANDPTDAVNVYESTDNGATWSIVSTLDLSTPFPNGAYSDSKLILHTDGYYYLCAYGLTSGTANDVEAGIWRSTDLSTWSRVATFDAGINGFTEGDVTAFGGTLVATIRHNAQTSVYTSTSTDGTTWSTPVLARSFAVSSPRMSQVGPRNRAYMVQRYHLNGNNAYFASVDSDGVVREVSGLGTGNVMYGQPAVIDDEDVSVFWSIQVSSSDADLYHTIFSFTGYDVDVDDTSAASTALAAVETLTIPLAIDDAPAAAAAAAGVEGLVVGVGVDDTPAAAAALAAIETLDIPLRVDDTPASATASAAPETVHVAGGIADLPAQAGAAAGLETVKSWPSAWTSELTGRALLGITTSPIDLHVPGPIATPPGAVTVRPILRNSHQMPAPTALVPRYAPGEYTVLDQATLGEDAIVGTWHVWVDGVDRTYDDDGELLDIDDLTAEKGFGDRSARLDIKRMQVWHESGVDDYDWLYPGAKVEAGIVHPDGSRTILFAGDLISDDANLTSTSFDATWTVQGTLVQAVQATMQPLDEMDPVDVGVLVPTVLNGIVSRRFPKIPTMPTPGVTSRKLGSYGQKVGDYVKAQLALAWEGDSQLMLAPDPVNRRQYTPAWTDTETVHWTLSAAAPGVFPRLGEDWSQVVNCYFGRGTLANGHRWMNRRFPYMLPYTPPEYFSGDTSAVLVLGSTDADTINNGVSLYTQRQRELGYKVRLSTVMLAEHVSATRHMQKVRGLLVDGIVGGQTWTSAWSVGATGADLRSVRLPLWVDPRVEPWLYLPNGAIAEPNTAYLPAWPRIEEDIEYGDNTTLAIGIADATQRGERTKEPGLVGTVTLSTDFWEGSRFLADPAHNLNLLGYRGRDRDLHIVGRTIHRKAGTVDLTVDSKYRDALTIRQLIARDAESKADPARRPGAIGRTSSTTAQDFTLFDGDSPAGIIPELTLRGGLWSVWPFPLDRAGTLARVWARTYDPATRFVWLMFGREVLPSQLHANLGNALTSTRAWTDPGIDAWLTRMGFITGQGQAGQLCGFSPGSEQDGNPLTGVFEAATPVNFVSQVKGFAWFAVIPEDDCRFEAEVDPQAKG